MTTNWAVLSRPLTPAEERAVAAIAQGMTYEQAAQFLRISKHTVYRNIQNAGAKIPGDLPLKRRVSQWYRGESPYAVGAVESGE